MDILSWKFGLTLIYSFLELIITICMMMIGYYINSCFYPKLEKIVMDNKMDKNTKAKLLEKAPKLALINVVFIRFISCAIGNSIFVYLDPNINSYGFYIQFLFAVLWFIGEYYNQQEIPHPNWYNDLFLGYFPWIPGLLVGYFLGLNFRSNKQPF